ncbi:MAG: VWA domain-containing protein [Microthrixaceae bacterium]|nr:VWA domain-containing protein [Microthrixaceae bacterium]
MTFASPLGLLALGLAIPIVALHILRSRRVEVTVASTLSWDEFDRPVAAARPWQRLRWSIPLILQLLAVALLALALAGPSLDTGKRSADHLVIILDTSASMAATDGSPTRLASARSTVDELTSQMGEGSVVSVIAAGAPARVVASRLEPSAIASRIDSLEPSEGGFDGEAASSLAIGMDSPRESVAYALVGDGGLTASDIQLLPAGTEFHKVGRRDANLGITNVVASASGERTHVQVTITNSGTSRRTAVTRVDVDGRDAASQSVTVGSRDSVEVGFDVPNGDKIAIHLDSNDLLALDNHAYAAGPSARELKVLRAGPDNLFLDALLATRPLVKVTPVATLAESTEPLGAFDLAIFDRVDVPSDISIPFLAIASPSGAPGVTVTGTVEAPVAALIRNDTALLDGLDLRELAIASAQRIDAPAATTLIGSEDTPLVVEGRSNGNPFVYMGFALNDSNFALLPTFPLFGDRTITTLGGSDLAAGSLNVGDPIPIATGTDVVVTSPSGTRIEVRSGSVPPELDRTGIWTIESSGAAADGAQKRLAVVNPAPGETEITPRTGLAIPGVEALASDKGAPVRRSLVFAAIILACAAVAAEWWFSARRRGVGARQWRFAAIARAAILGALIAALVIPSFTRRDNHVATVFVLDVSDSMAGGRAKAVEAVRQAIKEMHPGAAAGVVAVGADARVDATVAEELSWQNSDVRVDGSASDLAAGVRVAGAMVPSEYARRVVLVSDGRPTTGDLQAEIVRLRRSGVRLDVMPIDSAMGADVLVNSVEVPDRARPGESITLRVQLWASEAQRATVVLKRDDVEVDRRLVDLDAGDNTVEFTQPSGQPGTVRWSASVAGPANGIVENDLGRASTRIEGRAELLLIEGAPGEAAAMSELFSSFGASVTVVSPESLSDLSGLANYDAMVLVDVPLSSMSNAQVDAIVTATRDLGTGLVTIGGTSSYGAGEYLGSKLEDVLPVTSEVRDPKRRSKVAQVFAVDVSGSMGACHCAEGSNGNNSRLGGGVEKTDIARNAATRAIEGIDPTDELGVLALDDRFRWIRDLSPVGNGSKAKREMGEIKNTDRSTNLEPGFSESAKKLRESDASIRHIILFTDGFAETSSLNRLKSEAAELRESGITVSVMGTGEGAARELRAIADAGGGRYYPGRDLNALPNLLLQETKVVSRQLIVEGDFVPERTSSAPMVAGLDTAPPIGGYIATTAKPTAVTHMVVGEEKDPLLASWQVGLGKVVSWTSDAGGRWAGGWISWAGAPTFWADVLRSVYKEPMGSVQVRFEGAEGKVTASFDEPVPDGAEVNAVVVSPSGTSTSVRLRRLDDTNFEGAFESGRAGSYAVGVTASQGSKTLSAVSGVAELGYSMEYSSRPSDPELLIAASLQSGGNGRINSTQAFDSKGLEPGRRTVDLRRWLLIFAALALPIAVALSRLRFASGPDAVVTKNRLGRLGAVSDKITRTRSSADKGDNAGHAPVGASAASGSSSASPPSSSTPPPSRPPVATPSTPAAPPTTAPDETASGGSSLDSLLAAKRARRRDSDPGSSSER